LSNTFLNITYDDEHNSGGLSIRDIQLLYKKLRHKNDKPIKHFTAGEYGDRTQRPHYHAIIFGMEQPKDKQRWDKEYNHSQTLNNLWGKGNITFTDLTDARIAYATGYVLKKAGYRKQIYCDEDGVDLQPPFRIMSQGLGKAYLEKYHEDLKYGYYQGRENRQTIPRYYLDWLKREKEQLMAKIETRRDAHRQTLEPPNRERLKDAQIIMEQRVKQHKRDRI